MDELYNARCRLVLTAAAPPDALFSGGSNSFSEPLVDLEALQVPHRLSAFFLRRDSLFLS